MNIVMSEKKYTLSETEESNMVSEPCVAHRPYVQYSRPIYVENRGGLADAISGEELKIRLHESLKSRF